MGSDTSTSDDNMDDEIFLFHSAVAAAQVIMCDSDSESDTEAQRQWSVSKKGKSLNLQRDFEGACNMVKRNYFVREQSLSTKKFPFFMAKILEIVVHFCDLSR